MWYVIDCCVEEGRVPEKWEIEMATGLTGSEVEAVLLERPELADLMAFDEEERAKLLEVMTGFAKDTSPQTFFGSVITAKVAVAAKRLREQGK